MKLSMPFKLLISSDSPGTSSGRIPAKKLPRQIPGLQLQYLTQALVKLF